MAVGGAPVVKKIENHYVHYQQLGLKPETTMDQDGTNVSLMGIEPADSGWGGVRCGAS